MSFFDLQYNKTKYLCVLDLAREIGKQIQTGNSCKIMMYFRMIQNVFYQFIRHFKRIFLIVDFSILEIAEKDLVRCGFSMKSVCESVREFFAADDTDFMFNNEVTVEVQRLITVQKRLILNA